VHPLVLAASAGGPLATQPAAAAAAAAADAPAPFAETLAALGTDAAHDRLERIVREHLAALTGIADAHAIADDSGFASLGLDSMGAMELRNRVQAQIEHRLPATVAFNYPTVATLTAHLARVLAPEADACAPAPASEAALSGLSTRQLGALLDARLNAIGREETGS
jgi:acyl carrier protein